MMTPAETLKRGVEILDEVLHPAGFVFEFRGEGRGSGGDFAWGEYVRDNRRLQLHFRRGLGLVTYRVSDHSASHEAYMRGLNVWERCRYPGFSAEPLSGFRDLAHDLCHAQDFLVGDASILRQAAAEERELMAVSSDELMAAYVGDTTAVEEMRDHFRAGRFREVVSTFENLCYPRRVSATVLKMVEIARERTGG